MNRDVKICGRLIPDSGKIHQNQEVYLSDNECLICTSKATHYKDPPKILIKECNYEQNYTVSKF